MVQVFLAWEGSLSEKLIVLLSYEGLLNLSVWCVQFMPREVIPQISDWRLWMKDMAEKLGRITRATSPLV